jgi:hypothetical protein
MYRPDTAAELIRCGHRRADRVRVPLTDSDLDRCDGRPRRGLVVCASPGERPGRGGLDRAGLLRPEHSGQAERLDIQTVRQCTTPWPPDYPRAHRSGMMAADAEVARNKRPVPRHGVITMRSPQCHAEANGETDLSREVCRCDV